MFNVCGVDCKSVTIKDINGNDFTSSLRPRPFIKRQLYPITHSLFRESVIIVGRQGVTQGYHEWSSGRSPDPKFEVSYEEGEYI